MAHRLLASLCWGSEVGVERVLEEYVSDTKAVGWISGTIPPLEGEPVIAVYEEDGAIKHVKACYETAAGRWSETCLQGRPCYWIYDLRSPRGDD